MPKSYTANDLLNAIAAASKTLSERKDEINRLNVFPVPDGFQMLDAIADSADASWAEHDRRAE